MNLKYFSLFVFFIALVSIGCVCAGENTTDDNLGLEQQQAYESNGQIDYLDVEYPKEINTEYYSDYWKTDDDWPYVTIKNINTREDFDKLKVYVDGKEFTNEVYWSIYGEIPPKYLTKGSHVLEVKYVGEKNISKNLNFKVLDIACDIPEHINLKQKDYIPVTYSKDVTGDFKVYVNDKLFDSWTAKKNQYFHNVNIKGLSQGVYKINVKYSGNKKYSKFNRQYTLIISDSDDYCILKAPNLSMTYSDGSNYNIKLTDNHEKAVVKKLTLYIDGKKYKTLKTDKNGLSSFKVNLKPGTYKLKICFDDWKISKIITVKHLLKFKKVNVKKSKKLTLSASLKKVNGKYLVSKKVIFKFNGKKYIAKTNKNGVAKITLKKSVLKKLKVGNAVGYQATYLKDTIKKSSIVKR